MSKYQRFYTVHERRRARLDEELLRAKGMLRQALEPLDSDWAVSGRIKSGLSTWRKMRRIRADFQDIHDTLGLRVLVDQLEDCYAVIERVRAAWQDRCFRFRDYAAHPKENGYQSLHICVADADLPVFELQVRTREMHACAEIGTAAHWQYKLAMLSAAQLSKARPPRWPARDGWEPFATDHENERGAEAVRQGSGPAEALSEPIEGFRQRPMRRHVEPTVRLGPTPLLAHSPTGRRA